MKVSQQWYLQVDGLVRGPFPSWQIARYLILKRISPKTMASRDQEKWFAIANLPELSPERKLTSTMLGEDERAVLQASQKWVEEHPDLFRERNAHVAGVEGELESVTYHTHPEALPVHNRKLAYLMVLLLAATAVGVPFLLPSSEGIAIPQCDASAAPGVNWSNCLLPASRLENSDLSGALLRNANLSSSVLRAANLAGSDLAYSNLAITVLRGANLRGANLQGANLRNSDLRNSDLRDANLTYADLSGAQLDGAKLLGAKLGNAVWNEDVRCMPESVGRCIQARLLR